MRLIPTGRGTEVVQLPDVTHCAKCGQRFERPDYVMSWRQCGCQGDSGHMLFCCLRPGCNGLTYDPPCTRPDSYDPLAGHRH